MLRNQDEDELKEILSSTFTNNNYIDEEISELFMVNEQPYLKPVESSQSQRSSEMSESSLNKEILSSGLYLQPVPISSFSQEQKVVQKINLPVVRSIHIFDQFYQSINKSLKPQSLEQVRQKYPLFLLSQPNSDISGHIKQINLTYSGGLLKKNVLVIDAGYCQQQKVYKIAVGTDEGNVIIFQPNSSKPQQVIVCFNKICMITNVKWSKNLQYLAIANDEKQVYVYSFKQAIHIQNQVSYRLLKSPVEYCYLNEKQLKNIVIQLYFVQQIPFQMLLVTQNDDIINLQMKRHIINMRPHLTPLPYHLNNFLDLSLISIQDSGKNQGVLMAVSGYQFVTVCVINPSFEIAIVYDKQKHGGKIKKNGFPSVSFRQNPSSMMVIWDKYLEIMSLNIQSYLPLKYTFSITHKFLLPDSTIIGGFLSNSMVYQVTRVGVKIYSVTKFLDELSNKYENDEVLCHKINFQNFCYGERIEEAIGNNNIQLQDLRYLKGLFIVTNRTLFFSTNKGIDMIYFNTMQQYVTYLVENNNWKTALQILKNCFLGEIYELDEIITQIIVVKVREYSSRYINFLQTIILSDITNSCQNNILLLWNQELIFIFNILITTQQEIFLFEEIFTKIYKINHIYINNIIPFILTNKINKITYRALQILIDIIPKQYITKLLFNLQTNNNDPELPHQINNLLIKHQMYLEFVDINQKFKDHYTSIAVLLGLYLKLQQDNDRNIMELTQEKSKIGKLIAYSVHDTLYSINFNKYSKQQNKQILQSTLPLMIEQIFPILIKQQPMGLFQNILEQLYMGNCLQTLNQLDLVQGDIQIMQKIIKNIPYHLVVQFKCEKKYWICVLKLFGRRIIDLDIFNGLKYLCIEDHVDVEYIEKFTKKCGELIIKEINHYSQIDINCFFDKLLQTNHICLIKLIGKQLNRFIDVIDALFCQQSERNMKIYEYLDECLPVLSQFQIKKLRIILKQNIKLLTSLDPNRASDIICKYYLPDLNLFIDDLNDFHNLQTKLIHSVLQLYSYKESLYTLKIKYLELLAITGHHQTILHEIMKENFPLDESLQICKKYQVLQAYAYLLVRSGGSGNTETAIKVYFRIIWQKIIKLIVINHGIECKKQLQSIIMKNVGECIKVCMQLDLKHHQTEWFIIMQQLQALKKNIFRNLVIDAHTCETLKIIINKQAYPQLIKMLIVEVTYENIIQHLKIRLSTFDLEAIQIVIDEMVKNYLYQRRMFVVSQNIFIDTQNFLRKSLLNAELQGFATQDKCHMCEQRGGLLVHYKCGHEIHPSCGQDVRECILCKQIVSVIYAKKMDLMQRVKIQIYSGGLPEDLQQVEYKIVKETKLKRMLDFDQMSGTSFNDYQLQ